MCAAQFSGLAWAGLEPHTSGHVNLSSPQRRVARGVPAGGAAGAASSYLRGDVTASDGLFAPFPHADSAMRREVAESLLRYPHLADRLWDSASKQAQLPQEND